MSKALILFAHGARDPRWVQPFQRLQKLIEKQLPDIVVTLAFLDLMKPSLPEATDLLVGQGCGEITVVPVFFGQGGHVLRDLPLIIDDLRVKHPALKLRVAAAVGEDEGVLQALAVYCIDTATAR